MAEEMKQEQVEKQEKTFNQKVTELVETKIEKLIEAGVQVGNIDYFSRLVDIHKDMKNEDYWEVKKEVLRNDVR